MYLEIDPALTDSHEAIRQHTRAFAREVLRPAARKLDKLPQVDEAPGRRARRRGEG